MGVQIWFVPEVVVGKEKWEGPACCGQCHLWVGGHGCVKIAEQAIAGKPVSSVFLGFASVPDSSFLPSISS